MSGIEREKIYICNDCELNFFSKGTPPGLSIVAGTGSIATGIAKDFSKTRSGGWGNAISDEGSGGWIGISVIKDFLRYYDGYGEYHHVFDIIREHLGESSFDELPGTLSQGSVKETAGFAKLVMDEADKGDKYCSCLTDKAAELVAEIACSVYKKLNFSDEISVDVVMSGSLFKSPSFYKAFKNYLNAMTMRNNFNFCGDVLSPVMGGITLACSMFA
jgi:N-acetylglucosamine kinase-like BadF-type ATPase